MHLVSWHRRRFCILGHLCLCSETNYEQVSRDAEHLGYHGARRDGVLRTHFFYPLCVCAVRVRRPGRCYHNALERIPSHVCSSFAYL